MFVPFITLEINIPQLPASIGVFYAGVTETAIHSESQIAATEATAPFVAASTAPLINYFLLILIVYATVSSLLLFRLLRSCRQMLVYARKNDCIDYHGAKLVLVKEKLVPHSFGQYIFINKEDYRNGLVPDEILVHEWTHVRQRHTWDIIFIELLIAFGWFNPVFYLYRNKIKQNHEYLADNAVIKDDTALVPAYQIILINHIPQNKNINFTSNFNFLITKKRLVMMTKTTSKKRVWCSSIALIPLFIAAIFVFSTKIIAQDNAPAASSEATVANEQQIIFPAKGVAPELLAEFEAIVSKYRKDEKWITNELSGEDITRLYVIYMQMDTCQRECQWIYFTGLLTISKVERERGILKHDWQSWSKPNKGNEIWLDGKRVEHSALAAHARTDFAAFISRYTSATKETFRIDLWTKKGYKEYIQQYGQQISVAKLLEIPPRIQFVTAKKWKNNTTISTTYPHELFYPSK
jgi:beta-lactamase regulating signal transducer with metallopeptidase domain